jgi:hypothetical protein
MSWIELDDAILDHPKFIRAVRTGGSGAVHLWLGFRAYCAKNLTDGAIPADMVDEVRGPQGKERERALKALLEVGLLKRADDSSPIVMHDYLQWSSSREEVLERRGKARERKARSRRDTPRDERSDSPRDSVVTALGVTPGVTNPRGRDPLHSPPHLSTPEEDPPTPLVESIVAPVPANGRRKTDNFLQSFKKPNRERPDVLALFDEWKELYGFPEAKLCVGIWNADADTLAEAIDGHGMELCRLVLKHSPNDGMVSGRDDENRVAHNTIVYIFGNQNAFLRIAKAAREASRSRQSGAFSSVIDRAKEAG